jgi:hypothetical protein
MFLIKKAIELPLLDLNFDGRSNFVHPGEGG